MEYIKSFNEFSLNESTSKPPKLDSFSVRDKMEAGKILVRTNKPYPDYKLADPRFKGYGYETFYVGPKIQVDGKLTNPVQTSKIESEKKKYEKLLDEKAESLGCVKESPLVYYFETGKRKKKRYYFKFKWKTEPTYETEFVINHCKDENGKSFPRPSVVKDLDKLKSLTDLQTYWLVPSLEIK